MTWLHLQYSCTSHFPTSYNILLHLYLIHLTQAPSTHSQKCSSWVQLTTIQHTDPSSPLINTITLFLSAFSLTLLHFDTSTKLPVITLRSFPIQRIIPCHLKTRLQTPFFLSPPLKISFPFSRFPLTFLSLLHPFRLWKARWQDILDHYQP